MVEDLKAPERCEVCGSLLPAPVLNLGMQPLCDDLVPVGGGRRCRLYPTEIAVCPVCITAHQKYPLNKETLFPPAYHYRARLTKDVLDGMQNLADSVGDVTGKVVWDIGCNDGSLLSIFRQRGAKTYGVEPTNAAAEAEKSGHSVLQTYFGLVSAVNLLGVSGTPDVITFTNVFAHVESLGETVEALKAVMGPHTLLIIENHYLGSVLAGRQFDTFYHEHPRTYSLESFKHVAARLRRPVSKVCFPSRYGGNIRVHVGGAVRPEAWVGPDERSYPQMLADLQGFVAGWVRQTTAFLNSRGRDRPLHGKSFPARASVLINLLGFSETLQPCVFEQEGSPKVGHYVPGTRIPIVSDREWQDKKLEPQAMIVWGWHIEKEVTAYLRKNGYAGKLFSPLPSFHEIDG